MYHKSYDLFVVMAVATIAMVGAIVGLDYVLPRVVLAFLLVLILPGYALVAALFPQGALELPEYCLLIIGFSIAVTGLGGFVLNVTPWGLQVETWAILLCGSILVASMAGLARRRKYPHVAVTPLSMHINVRGALLFFLAALIVTGTLATARIQAQQHAKASAQFTQLWILPANEAERDAVRLGINNMETTTNRYKLQVEARGAVIHEWPLVVLEPGNTWETTLSLPTMQPELEAVEAKLYRVDQPETVYRRGLLWLDSQKQ